MNTDTLMEMPISKEFLDMIDNIAPGVLIRVQYRTKVPTLAKEKNILIEKISSTTCRTGVRYNNIQKVIDRKSEQEPRTDDKPVKDNRISIIYNKLYYNKDTQSYYMRFATCPKGNHTKSIYRVIENGIDSYVFDKKELKKLYGDKIYKSYFGEKSSNHEIFDIRLENIISINNIKNV